MSFNKTLEAVKKAGEDFEWYPSDSKMLDVIIRDFHKKDNLKILDVGAGNGSSLDYFKKHTKNSNFFAIEKSQVLINNMDKNIFIIGTDFYQQSFIDKPMDIIFCNPPYSDYANWIKKLIKESYCKYMYLIIPERWDNSEEIKSIIDSRRATYETLGNFTFLDSEYRKARAKVDIVRIKFIKDYSGYGSSAVKDPFELWFNEHFNVQEKESTETKTEKHKEKINSITDKSKLIDNLVNYYNEDLNNLITNYKAVENLDADLLQELNIDIKGLMVGLKTKIEGLKYLYWKELFNNLNAITDRLTFKSRDSILSVLLRNTSVDFTHENIYSIVIWAIKNANDYIDSQLLELYTTLTESKNIIGYQSNKHMIDDSWRNCSRYDIRKKAIKYSLDYRCILEGWYGIHSDSSYYGEGGLKKAGHEVISDIFTIANNLGYVVLNDSRNRVWEAGKPQTFFTNKNEIFAEIKAFRNGNIHYKLNQNFMKAFNVAAGKLNGWIKTPKEASEEMGINLNEATAYFKGNNKLLSSNVLLLG